MSDNVHPVFERCDLVIDTDDQNLPRELMDTDKDPDTHSTRELDSGAMVTYEGTYIKKSAGATDAVMLTIDLARDVGLGVFSAWLYEKLDSREVTLSTPRGSIHIDDSISEPELETILQVLLEIEQGDQEDPDE